MKSQIVITEEQIKCLQENLKANYNGPVSSKRTYIELTKHINENLKKYGFTYPQKNGQEEIAQVSVNTVMRLFSYGISEAKKEIARNKKGNIYQAPVSIHSLDDFANSLRYKDWESFTRSIKTDKELFDPEAINPSKLHINEEVIVGWQTTHYYAKLKYLGNFLFEVVEREGIGREIGEHFIAIKFVIDDILFMGDGLNGYTPYPTILILNKNNTYSPLDKNE